MPSVGSMPCAASPTMVTRDGSQFSAGSRKPNGIMKIESGSMPSTSAWAAGCQPSIAAQHRLAQHRQRVSAVHSRVGGHDGARRDAAADHHVRRHGVDRDVRCDLARRLVGRPARPEAAR